MTVIRMPSLADTIYQGEHGTASIEMFHLELNADEDDEIILSNLPIGIEIYGIRAFHEKLGDESRIVVYAGEDEIGSFVADSEKGTTRTWKPALTTEPNQKLRLRVRDEAAAGKLTIMLEYESVGY